MPRILQKYTLTAGRIRDFQCPPGVQQAFLWDADAPGFGVRASASKKAFIWQGDLDGKTIRIQIGDVRAVDITDARREARRLYGLCEAGVDPRQLEAQQRAARQFERDEAARVKAPALDAWDAYIEARRPAWGAVHLRKHQQLVQPGGELRTRGKRPGESELTIPGALRFLLDRPLADVDSFRVRAWLKSEATLRPTQGALAYRMLRAFMTWCTEQPQFRDQVHADACPARLARDELPRRAAKADCLQKEQLFAWFDCVRRIANPVVRNYLQALLLTGARREELAGLRWEDVDFAWKSIVIRDKVDGTRNIPLTPFVSSLLAELPRRNEFVFFSHLSASGRIEEPRHSHNQAVAAAGLPALTLHGLRRSFSTLAEWTETPVGVVAQIQGHKPSAIAEKHYRVRPLDLLRSWHEKLEAWILEQAGIPLPGETARPALRVITVS